LTIGPIPGQRPIGEAADKPGRMEDGDYFWGDDRLEQALEWAMKE